MIGANLYPYYGIDFPNSEPTGRFSNGYNIADFIAKAMGLEISPLAYLSLTSRPISVKGFTGVNYASESARIWNHSISADDDEVRIPLLTQLDYFADTRAQMVPQLREHQLRKLLFKSLFLVSIGTKDIFHLSMFTKHPKFNAKAYVDKLVTSFGACMEALYNDGAWKFAVINIPPIGCTPEGRRKAVGRRDHHYGPGGCDQILNELAVEFNIGLRSLLASLSSKLDGLRYSIGDFYSFSNGTFANPEASGT
ncbi:GDSL esterase/lipase At5g55050-like [Setaria viridis]|uniref:GDSL esterase/lipase At5g55050-like n=1 Tax=Setaria viridis TaxID=4556 RepID=UPI003B3A04D4